MFFRSLFFFALVAASASGLADDARPVPKIVSSDNSLLPGPVLCEARCNPDRAELRFISYLYSVDSDREHREYLGMGRVEYRPHDAVRLTTVGGRETEDQVRNRLKSGWQPVIVFHEDAAAAGKARDPRFQNDAIVVVVSTGDFAILIKKSQGIPSLEDLRPGNASP